MSDEVIRNIQLVRRFAARPEQVFDAWLDPRSAGRWLFATPKGEMVRAEIDARVGGGFVLTDRREGADVEHIGRYLELDRPRRLAFSFAVPAFGAEETRVCIDIISARDGAELTLTHHAVPLDVADRAFSGWTMILSGLTASLGGS